MSRLAARDRRYWAVVPSGVSPRLGVVRGNGGCHPVLSLSIHIIAVAVVTVVRRASRGNRSENEPQYLTWLVFVTHLLGLSLLGPSFRVSLSRFLCRTRINRPHPSGEGRGRCVRACLLVEVSIEPTSRERGGTCFWVVGCG